MGKNEPRVYVSYAWGGESERIVNELDADFQASGITIIRDKRDLGYKGTISEFMQEIGRGYAIVVVISDKYLKSPNCMYELVEIANNKNIYDRIFPIVLADADIYKPTNRINYIKHWEEQIKELDEAMKTISAANQQGLTDEINSYDEIRDNISKLTYMLKDMNTLTPEMHEGSNFARLIEDVKKRLAESAPSQKKVSEKRTKSTVKTEAGSIDAYLEKVTRKLVREKYEELEDERFGRLKFDRAFARTDHERVLLIQTEDYHRFVFIIEPELGEDRFIELEKEIKSYCDAEFKKVDQSVYTFGVILTNQVSEDLKDLIYETTPAKYEFMYMAYTAIAVYDAATNDLVFAKDITEEVNSDFTGKIKSFLKP